MRLSRIILGFIAIGIVIICVLAKQGKLTMPDNIVLLPKVVGPGSCLILEEKYCGQGHFVYPFNNSIVGIGFNLPPGAIVFSPYSGITGFLTTAENTGQVLPPSVIVHNIPAGGDLTKNHNLIIFFADSFLKNEIHETVEKDQALSKIERVSIPGFNEYNLVVVVDNPAERGTVYANAEFYLTDTLTK
jgi:hypothetical protein